MSEARILIVDDEPQILRFLRPSLTAAGYDVLVAATGKEALKAAATLSPDVIVLDLGLPDMDGKDVIRELRAWSTTPILVLSARDREAEKIAALDLGADDYVNKPFGIGELMARVRAALRRRAAGQGEEVVVKVADIEIDRIRRRVSRGGEEVKLTPKEFELLSFLAGHAGQVLTHKQILTAVWGAGHADDTHYLRVYVGHLRHKIEARPGDPKIIMTEPGVGYRIADEGEPRFSR
jgi:two-component system KDP operon response regulator KdpE